MLKQLEGDSLILSVDVFTLGEGKKGEKKKSVLGRDVSRGANNFHNVNSSTPSSSCSTKGFYEGFFF